MVSIMNGLSAMGAGIASFAGSAGLEQQKADLARQGVILANQLATEREHTGRVEAGEIAATAAQKEFGYKQELQAPVLATQVQTATIGAEATKAAAYAHAGAILGAARTQADAERAVAMIRANEPSAEAKTLKYLGIPEGLYAPSKTTDANSAAPAPTPEMSAIPSPSPSPPPSPAPSTPGGTMAENIVANVLHVPVSGSAAANRQAIAQDVNNDPDFKYKTAGQKAAEIESRVAVAEGKMTDPTSRHDMAVAIASYQKAPLDNMAAQKPGGPETMAEVFRINPNYQEARYPEVAKVMAAFGSGKQGDIVRSNNVVVQHTDVLEEAAKALGNGDVQALNKMGNWFEKQFGSSAPTTFDGLKQIVATEIEKSVAGGIGATGDRDRLMASLDRANSPTQLQDMLKGFRSLMLGQLIGLKQQYEDGTSFTSGPFAFDNKLLPATRTRLNAPDAPPAAPITTLPPIATGLPQNDYGRHGASGYPSTAPPPSAKSPGSPAAPPDPADREQNKSYLLPNGRIGVWAGTGWRLLQ